jgi:hypothetical protein
MNMNDNPTVPPLMPVNPPSLPPGATPEEREPVRSPVAAIEALLRQPRRIMYLVSEGRTGTLIGALFVVALVSALVYGAIVGSFTAGAQLWIAPLKVCGGLFAAALICLPSLYVFSCLAGSQARLSQVVALVTGLVTLSTILLIGFAPVAWVFAQSTSSVVVMGVLHLGFWLVATWFGWRFLRAAFEYLSARSGGTLNAWFVIFLLVSLQMTAALRPIIGTAPTVLPTEKKFFLSHWFENLSAETSLRK